MGQNLHEETARGRTWTQLSHYATLDLGQKLKSKPDRAWTVSTTQELNFAQKICPWNPEAREMLSVSDDIGECHTRCTQAIYYSFAWSWPMGQNKSYDVAVG